MPFDRAPSRVEGPNEVGACAPRTRVTTPSASRSAASRTHRRAPMAATDSPGEMSVADEQMPTGEQSASFRFEARRARLDWRLLHSVDVDRLMRENDLDMLETTLVRIVTLLLKRRPLRPPKDGCSKSLTEISRLTTTPRPRPHTPPRQQETVAFGDVTVEDSRNLTVNNSRKILRLAQCQVEYLLHVQETLVSHKERLRRVAEDAQRECIDAKSRFKHERVRTKTLKRELRTAKKALRTYEVLEQIRSGKPLDEILTGAIVFAGPDGEGSIAPGPGHSVRMSQTMDAIVLPTLAALATPGLAGKEKDGGDLDSPDVMAAKAAARAMERLASEKDFERVAASATEAANKLRVEKEAAERARDEAVSALKDANETAERSLRDQADAFERTMLSMETQLRRAQTAAEEARAKAEVEIADAKRERETFKAESRAASQRETSAMRTEIDALKLSLGDSNSSDALVQSAAALAAAKAALAATEQRLADQEAHDAETIADLRTRLNEKKRECDEFKTRAKTLEEQLVSVAVAASTAPSLIGTPLGTPTGAPRSPYGIGHAVPGSPPGAIVERDLSSPNNSPLSARRWLQEFNQGYSRDREDIAPHVPDPAIQRDLEEAKAEFAKAKRAADEAKSAKEDLERLRSELHEERVRAAKEEVERLRASNDALSLAAEEERSRAVAAKAAELEARERAVKDAEERSEKVRAASAALEAADLKRRLAEEEAARLRKTTPEREKGSDLAFAELRVRAEEAKKESDLGVPSSGGGGQQTNLNSGGSQPRQNFDAASSAVVTAPAEPEPRVREKARMDDVRVVTAEEPTVAPAAPPATKAAASAPKRLVVDEQKEIKKEEEDTEEVFTGTIVKPFTGTIVKPTKDTVPFTGTIVKHAVKPTETVTEQEKKEEDDMEGEMIVKEDVEHVPAPVMLSSSGGTMRRVPSHPRINPATTSPVGSPGDGPGVTAVTAPRSSPRVPPGLGSRSPRWTKVAESVTKLSPRTTPRSPPPLGRQSSAGATATSPSKSPSSLSQRGGVPTSPPSLTRTASAEARSPPSPAVTARPATRSPERWGHAMAALERGAPEAAAPVTAAAPSSPPKASAAVASSPPKASPRKSILKPTTVGRMSASMTPPAKSSSPRSPPSANPRAMRRSPAPASPGNDTVDSAAISEAMRGDPNLADDSRQFSVSDISGDVSVSKSP